ncbi:hypothetical protein PWT90_03077 [Aphanocladium album]|nr:hypothetical protein PWT90_03077 [Aphanocladium album]
MKFSLAAIIALPLAAVASPVAVPEPSSLSKRGCTIHGQWESNWVEYANSRYRVKVWHDGGDDNLNSRWCDFYYSHGSFVIISNPQCWQDGDHAFADVSYGQGPVGYEQYKKTFWDAFIAMGHETGCDLNVNL